MIFLLVLFVFISLLLIKYKLYKKRLMKYVGHLPSPAQYPLIGSGYMFIGKNTRGINVNFSFYHELSISKVFGSVEYKY